MTQELIREHVNNALTLLERAPIFARDFVIKWSKCLPTLQTSDEPGIPMHIVTPLGMYPFEFDELKIKTYVHHPDIKPIKVNPSNLYKSIHLLHEKSVVDAPILIESPLFPRPYILMGHQKIQKAIQKNLSINAYCLAESEFVPFLKDDLNKGMYAFLRDVQIILDDPRYVRKDYLFYTHKDKLFEH